MSILIALKKFDRDGGVAVCEVVIGNDAFEVEVFGDNETEATAKVREFLDEIKRKKLLPATIVKFRGLALGDVYEDDYFCIKYYNDCYWGEQITVKFGVNSEILLRLWAATVKRMYVVEDYYYIQKWKVSEFRELSFAGGKIKIKVPVKVYEFLINYIEDNPEDLL